MRTAFNSECSLCVDPTLQSTSDKTVLLGGSAQQFQTVTYIWTTSAAGGGHDLISSPQGLRDDRFVHPGLPFPPSIAPLRCLRREGCVFRCCEDGPGKGKGQKDMFHGSHLDISESL